MHTLTLDHDITALEVIFSEDAFTLVLDDGRTVSAPLAWYPRLLNGSQAERSNYQLIADGEGIHWPELDEDISVESIVAGRRSAETSSSLSRWLAGRK